MLVTSPAGPWGQEHGSGHTRVFKVVQSIGEDLDGAGHVQKVKLVLQDHKNLNWLIRHRGGLVCSHRAGIEGGTRSLALREW